jgi:HlyD family secretion protein
MRNASRERSGVFRKVALERLSSPEQLDQLVEVTRPGGWIALGALATLLLATVAWGVLGTIPTVASGEGMLLRRGGVSDLVTIASGQVEEVLVEPGDPLHKGQVAARVRQEGLVRQVAEARSRLRDLGRERAEVAAYAAEQRGLRRREQAQKQANLERSIATLEREAALLAEQVEAETALLGDGLITKQTLLATEQRLNAARDQLAAHRLELDGIDLVNLEEEQRLSQELLARDAAIREVELQLVELQASLEENVAVVASHDGRVLELMAERGDVVQVGDPVLSFEMAGEELVAVLFVPASDGKKIRPGMAAQVVPATVKREEHGYMEGEVTWVADYPSTSRGMLRLLANDTLVERLIAEGPPIQVNVTLRRDAATPTGFAWTSSRGPELDISSGTLASGRVIVRRDRPLQWLVPLAREAMGL